MPLTTHETNAALITGGAGFIGSHICDALIDRGTKVVLYDNLDPQVHGSDGNWPSYLNREATLVKGDIRDQKLIGETLDSHGVNQIIHLAAKVGVGQSMYEIVDYTSVNNVGTAALLEEVAKRKSSIEKLIVASSMSIYGEGSYKNAQGELVFPKVRTKEQLSSKQWEHSDNNEPLAPSPTSESKQLYPESIYAINKRDQEEMVLAFGRAYNIPAIAFRMFNVYGARQALSNPYTGVAAIFSSHLLRGKRPPVYEDGLQLRDFVNVKDVAYAYCEALASTSLDGLAVNLGSGYPISVIEIAETLAALLGLDIKPEIRNISRLGDIRHCFADISLLQSKIGYEPITDFKEGVAELLEWLKDQIVADSTDASEILVRKGLMK